MPLTSPVSTYLSVFPRTHKIGVPANTQKPGDPAKPCHDLNGTRSVRYEVTEAPEGTDPLGPGCLEDRIQGEVVAVDVR